MRNLMYPSKEQSYEMLAANDTAESVINSTIAEDEDFFKNLDFAPSRDESMHDLPNVGVGSSLTNWI